MDIILDIVMDALLDVVKLLPFLLLTYLAMELLEHKAGNRVNQMVQKAGRLGPIVGGILGVIPQCGFSAAAAGFYAGHIISLGTLFAIFLSTSDEMLPILISEQISVRTIFMILGIKVCVAVVAGFMIDLLYRPKGVQESIHELCEQEHCHCEQGIFRSALRHTLQIAFFLLLVGLFLGGLFEWMGEDAFRGLALNHPVLGPVLSALVGLLPNCAASVIITKLYLEQALGMGAMIAGLLTNAGVGVLVLFRANKNKKENLCIVGLLYGIGVISGIVLSLIFG